MIFADPPYEKYDYQKIFEKIKPFINKNGIFCMEMEKTNVDKSNFEIRVYGNTQLILWRCDE